MAKNVGVTDWQFSGSEAAKKAASYSLGVYTSKLYALCDANGNTILPPRDEILETSHTAEKAVVKTVLYGTGNAYAPSIGLPAAKSAVAEYLNRDLPNKITADDVFMTVGCKQAIELAVDILAKPGANVLLPKPGFPWDVVRSIYKNLEIREYEFDSNKNFEIDIESVRAVADENTFAIFIINPHNPIGNTYSEAHLKQVAELARELGILVVSDEVYRWTLFGENPFVPMGKFSSIVPVVTLGSISKGWKVPGWRTGWLALHDLDGVFRSNKILEAAREFLEINSKPATVIQTELNISSFSDIKDDEEFCAKLATEENIVILPGKAFGQRNWLRHAIDMESPMLEDAYERLKNFCERHSVKTQASLNGVN